MFIYLFLSILNSRLKIENSSKTRNNSRDDTGFFRHFSPIRKYSEGSFK